MCGKLAADVDVSKDTCSVPNFPLTSSLYLLYSLLRLSISLLRLFFSLVLTAHSNIFLTPALKSWSDHLNFSVILILM